MTYGSNLNALETKQIYNVIKRAKKRYVSDNLEASKGNPRQNIESHQRGKLK